MSGVVAVHVGEFWGEGGQCRRRESLKFGLEVMVVGFFVGGVPLANSLSGLRSLAFSLSPLSPPSGPSRAGLGLGTPGAALEGRVSGRKARPAAPFLRGNEEVEEGLAGQWIGLRVEGAARAGPRKWTLWRP